MIKKTVKSLLFIAVVLTLGQISVSDRTLAERFVGSLAVSVKWTAIKISQSPMLSGVEIPPFLKKWISEKKKIGGISAQADPQWMTDPEQEKLLQLLN